MIVMYFPRIACAAILVASIVGGLALPARGDAPTREAIAAYSAECKQAGQRMDAIARFGTDFSGLDLRGVDLRGPHAIGLETNLQGANFAGANLHDAEFGAANLDGADFTSANLDDAYFVTASLKRAIFARTSLRGTRFNQCDLSGAMLDGVDLSQGNISGCDFSNASLAGATLAGCTSEYWWMDFGGANLRGAKLQGVNLQGADFRQAHLNSADLSGCQLEQADFTDTDLTDASFAGANVDAADFRRARRLAPDERLRLLAQARRTPFEWKRGLTEFLDSAAFPVCLGIAAVISAIAVAARRRKRSAAKEFVSPARFQFSLAGLFIASVAVCLFVAIGKYSIVGAFSFAMAAAGYLMLVGCMSGRAGSGWSAWVLALGLGYAAANIGVYFLVFHLDPFAIFASAYMITSILLGPLAAFFVAVASLVAQPKLRAHPPWGALAGIALWMTGVGFANACLIAAASAAV